MVYVTCESTEYRNCDFNNFGFNNFGGLSFSDAIKLIMVAYWSTLDNSVSGVCLLFPMALRQRNEQDKLTGVQMAEELTTADVYDQASLIGQDIEKIFDRFGHDAMINLMPKIIRVLEQLEIMVGEREKGKQEMAELKLENERLYLEIKREANQRRRLDEVCDVRVKINTPSNANMSTSVTSMCCVEPINFIVSLAKEH